MKRKTRLKVKSIDTYYNYISVCSPEEDLENADVSTLSVALFDLGVRAGNIIEVSVEEKYIYVGVVE